MKQRNRNFFKRHKKEKHISLSKRHGKLEAERQLKTILMWSLRAGKLEKDGQRENYLRDMKQIVRHISKRHEKEGQGDLYIRDMENRSRETVKDDSGVEFIYLDLELTF